MKFRIERIPYYLKLVMTIINESSSRNKILMIVKWVLGTERYIYMDNHKIGLYFEKLTDLLEIKEVIIDDEYFTSSYKSYPRLIVDVGAGVGDFSIMMAKRFPKATVFAIDSNRSRYELLEKNIKANSVTNIVPLLRHVQNVQRLISLPNKKIDLLKFDCEGCEFPILLSAKKGQLKNIMRIVMEYHTTKGRTLEQMTRKLKGHGFVVDVVPNLEVSHLGHLKARKPNCFF